MVTWESQQRRCGTQGISSLNSGNAEGHFLWERTAWVRSLRNDQILSMWDYIENGFSQIGIRQQWKCSWIGEMVVGGLKN